MNGMHFKKVDVIGAKKKSMQLFKTKWKNEPIMST